MEVEVGLCVCHELGRHGADDGQLVRNATDVGEQVTDRDSALPVVLELPGTGEDVAILVEHGALGLERHRLAGFAVQSRLGIERIDLREPSREVTKNNVLDLGREVGTPGGKWPICTGLSQSCVGRVSHQGRQGQHPETGGSLAQHFTAGQVRFEAEMMRIKWHGYVVLASTLKVVELPSKGV